MAARALLATLVLASTAFGAPAWAAPHAGADPATVEPGVPAPARYGVVARIPVRGSIVGRPAVSGGTAIVGTDEGWAYGVDIAAGVSTWSRDLGVPWSSATVSCGNGAEGVAAGAAIDTTSATAYVVAKSGDGTDALHPNLRLHALDLATGAERPGFPVEVLGSGAGRLPGAAEATSRVRAALVLLGGRVYVGVGGECDRAPARGWVLGFDAGSGRRTGAWAATDPSTFSGGGAIDQSGDALLVAGPDRLLVTTGAGRPPQGVQPVDLADSAVALSIDGDGSLRAVDHFTPASAPQADQGDRDLGGGAVTLLPAAFGAGAHPNLAVVAGKEGVLHVLDADSLAAPIESLPSSGTAVGRPAFHVDTSDATQAFVYLASGQGLTVFQRYLAGDGSPLLVRRAGDAGANGPAVGSPLVTGDATRGATVWVVQGAPDAAVLVAYDALPVGAGMRQRVSVPVGTVPAGTAAVAAGDRMLVGASGQLVVVGATAPSSVTVPPLRLPPAVAGAETTAAATVAATTPVDVLGASVTEPFSLPAQAFPIRVDAEHPLTLAVSARATAAGDLVGELRLSTSAGDFITDVRASVLAPTGALSFDPPGLGLGALAAGAVGSGQAVLRNTGATPVTVAGFERPGDPFALEGLPVAGTVVAPGAALAVDLTAKGGAGAPATTAAVRTTDGVVATLPIQAIDPAPVAAGLVLEEATIGFGFATVGEMASSRLSVHNPTATGADLIGLADPTPGLVADLPVHVLAGATVTVPIGLRPAATGDVALSNAILAADGTRLPFTVTAVASTNPGSAVAPLGPGWTATGGASVRYGEASVDRGGAITWPSPVGRNGLRVKVTLDLGASPGPGASIVLREPDASPATTASDTPVPGLGGAEGIAAALDRKQDPGDPAATFAGIASSSARARAGYIATRPTPLAAGRHVVELHVQQDIATMTVDGGPPLAARVPAAKGVLVSVAGGGVGTKVVAVEVQPGSASPAVTSGAVRGFGLLSRTALAVALAAVLTGLALAARDRRGSRRTKRGAHVA